MIRKLEIGKDASARTKVGKLKIPANLRAGQALVILLVFVATATIITAAAVTVTLINARSTGKLAQGEEALAIAEAGADNAILRILRDPQGSYEGETVIVGDGSATVTISANGNTKTITSKGTVGDFIRTVQAVATQSGNAWTVTSWQQID